MVASGGEERVRKRKREREEERKEEKKRERQDGQSRGFPPSCYISLK